MLYNNTKVIQKWDWVSHNLSNVPSPTIQTYTRPRSAVGNMSPGVTSLILARSHTFVEIDYEIISTVILLLSAESFKKNCCKLQAKVCEQSTG